MLVFVAIIFLGSRTGYNNTSSTAVNQWFVKKRSLAMSTLSIGNGRGEAIFGPTIGLMVSTMGWRPTALISGIVILVVVAPLSLLVQPLPRRPARGGLARFPEAGGAGTAGQRQPRRGFQPCRTPSKPGGEYTRQPGILEWRFHRQGSDADTHLLALCFVCGPA